MININNSLFCARIVMSIHEKCACSVLKLDCVCNESNFLSFDALRLKIYLNPIPINVRK